MSSAKASATSNKRARPGGDEAHPTSEECHHAECAAAAAPLPRPTKKIKNEKLPVLLLSGFLGAGKTTLLKNILHNARGQRIAVLVNDVAQLNVDANLVADLVQREQELVRLQNGCICCTLRVDLVEEISRLAKAGKYDALVIESTGISEPMQVAETFALDLPPAVLEEQRKGSKAALALGCLHDIARLDSCTTVVDASTFFANFERAETVQDDAMGQEATIAEDDERSLVGLLTEQVEFADLIILNKTDLMPAAELGRVQAAVRNLNPHAKIMNCSWGAVPLENLLHTRRFDLEKSTRWVDSGSRWFSELPGQHNPESLEYGVGSFIYRREGRPFHPGRLYDLISEVFNLTFARAALTHHTVYAEAEAQQQAEEESKQAGGTPGHQDAARNETDSRSSTAAASVGDQSEADDDDDDDDDDGGSGPAHYTGASLREAWCEMMGDDSRLLRSKGCVWMAGAHSHAFRIVWGHTGPYLHLEVDDPWKVR